MSRITQNIREIIKFPESCKEVTLPKSANAQSLREIGVNLAGFSDLVPGYEIARAAPHLHLAIFTIAGQGILESGDFTFCLKEGSLAVAPAGLPQRYYPHGEYWKKAWFHFEDTGYWKHLKKDGPMLRHANYLSAIFGAMQEFVTEDLSSMSESSHLARMYANILCVYLRRELKHSSTQGNIDIQNRLSRLWEQVYADLRRDWTLGELAEITFLSPSHLSRVCKQYYKSSPMKMVAKLRMQKAEEVLMTTDLPLTSVGEMVGYSNPFAFSTTFKRFYGLSPRAYRQSNR